MFDVYGSNSQEFDQNQFVASPLGDEIEGDPRYWITLIGTSHYGREVEMSGFVSVEREVLEAEAFLASLYGHG